ncbi:MAG: ThuA domain-containing protein [Granulosicoccus sp.]
MLSPVNKPVQLALVMMFTLLLLAGCSSGSSTAPTATAPQDQSSDGPPATVDDGTTTNPTDTTIEVDQSITSVNFNITVPAYSSNALQIRILWGDVDLNASWVGDEQWSASTQLRANTSHQLLVTFSDNNGEIPLASYEQTLSTGSNDSVVVTVLDNQFDSARWDSDNDGDSNLDELLAGTNPLDSPKVLLFSETEVFRHDSTETALLALEEIAAAANIRSERANDSTDIFTRENLADYDAVVWVMTSGDVLNASEQAAFENYIQLGGGYAGIHAASFTEYEWPWYGRLVGAYFDTHPEIQIATQIVEDGEHISTAHLGTMWTRTDEWYDYLTNPRSEVNVLLTLDENTYSGGTMGNDHPSAWYHDYNGGRSWYTGGGHTEESYSEPDFRAHLLGGLRYAAGIE